MDDDEEGEVAAYAGHPLGLMEDARMKRKKIVFGANRLEACAPGRERE